MENEDSVDVVSNDVTYSDTAEAELSDHEDDSEAKSSGCESSDDSYDSEDGDDSDDDDDDDADDSAGVNAEVNAGDRMVPINSITADEIVALEFSTVEEAYDFYYRYGKCKGFSIRKHDRRYGGPKSNRKLLMRQFVCSKQGLREKKHLCRLDRKREHRRLTRTDCKARLRVKYKAKKGTYVVSIFVEGHNHELTPSKYVHLHPVFRKISESDKAQIDGLQSHGESNMIEQARFGAYCAAFTSFCKEASKKDGVYGQIMEDILNLQKKLKRNVESDAVSVGDSLSQSVKVTKKGKRKQICDGETSVQNKFSVLPQNRGATTTSNIPRVNVSQPLMHVMPVMPFMPVMQSVGTSSQVQPMHPIYGMPFVQSSNSCFGLLQQVMNNAGNE
ncbi:hypothetical protein P8452_37190 [Trifolium repens]|nr:hypothetical protein P8452_37190 [Trifolium repens]